jgi:hypothetical protein
MGAPALGYLGAALLLLGLRGGFTPPPRPDARLFRDIREGVSFVTRHRVLRALALLAGLCALAATLSARQITASSIAAAEPAR